MITTTIPSPLPPKDVNDRLVDWIVDICQSIKTVSGSDKHYQHTQNEASDTWIIRHNLGKCPSVVVVDSGGNEWKTGVKHLDTNTLVVKMNVPFSGTAYCN